MGGGSSKEEPQVNLDQFIQQSNYQEKLRSVYQNQAQQQQLQVYQNEDEDYIYGGVNHNHRINHQQNQQMAGIQQTTLQAQTNDIYINKKSFTLVQMNQFSYQVLFSYTSSTPALIYIWILGQEDQKTGQVITLYTKKQNNIFNVDPGKNVEFQDKSFILDLNFVKIDQLKQFQVTQDLFSFPLIIRIQKINSDHSFTNYFSFKVNQQSIIPHCQYTKLRINGQNFLTQDVYGIDDSVMGNKDENEKQPCRICLTNPIDTMINPCQHVALCQDCCINLRNRGQNCPICRTVIKEFIIINKAT